jgi:hypothetical protein
MIYAIIKKATKFMPLMRHNRSQKAPEAYTLVDEVLVVVIAFMRRSSGSVACNEFVAPGIRLTSIYPTVRYPNTLRAAAAS